MCEVNGGEGGIRTHGDFAATTVFETAPIDHSGTSPNLLRPRPPASQATEEALEQAGTFPVQHTAGDLAGVIEARILDHVPQRAAGSGLWVVRPEHEPRDPCQHDSASAHGAWFEGDVENAVLEPPRPQGPRRLAQGDQLGMRRGILTAFGDVPTSTDDGSSAHNEGADRHLVLLGGDVRPLQGATHPEAIGIDTLNLTLLEHKNVTVGLYLIKPEIGSSELPLVVMERQLCLLTALPQATAVGGDLPGAAKIPVPQRVTAEQPHDQPDGREHQVEDDGQ